MKHLEISGAQVCIDEITAFYAIDFAGRMDGAGQLMHIRFLLPENATILSFANVVYSLMKSEVKFSKNLHDGSLVDDFAKLYNAVVEAYDPISLEDPYRLAYHGEHTTSIRHLMSEISSDVTKVHGYYVSESPMKQLIWRCDYCTLDLKSVVTEVPMTIPSDIMVAISRIDGDLMGTAWKHYIRKTVEAIRASQMTIKEYYEQIVYRDPEWIAGYNKFKSEFEVWQSEEDEYIKSLPQSHHPTAKNSFSRSGLRELGTYGL